MPTISYTSILRAYEEHKEHETEMENDYNDSLYEVEN